jgi:lipoate-protein ligase A
MLVRPRRPKTSCATWSGAAAGPDVIAEPFDVSVCRGAAADFHSADLLADTRPRVVVSDSIGPALVIGSRQSLDVVDVEACRAAGVDVVKRRSGGGAVLVEPAEMCWFDVVVPADDPRFAAVAGDVGASMRWLGLHVVAGLNQLGVDDVVAHLGSMSGAAWSDLVCFAGLGPGEVVRGGSKLVGVSQRRTRRGARFQCMVHVRWAPDRLVALLARPRPAVSELPSVAVLPPTRAAALPEAVAAALSAG